MKALKNIICIIIVIIVLIIVCWLFKTCTSPKTAETVTNKLFDTINDKLIK